MAAKDPIDKALAKAAKLVEERTLAGEATRQDGAVLKHIKAAVSWRLVAEVEAAKAQQKQPPTLSKGAASSLESHPVQNSSKPKAE